LCVGADALHARIESAKADTRGRDYQLQLIATAGAYGVFERRGAWAVHLGTGILVVN
jgi:hypothetical protein